MANIGASKAVQKELADLQADAQNMANEYGLPVEFVLSTAQTISLDAYGGRKNSGTTSERVTVAACKVEYTPTERKYEAAGIRESSDLIIWVPVKEFTDNDIDYGRLSIALTQVNVEGERYEVIAKNSVCKLGSGWIYYTFGLKQK